MCASLNWYCLASRHLFNSATGSWASSGGFGYGCDYLNFADLAERDQSSRFAWNIDLR